jgi:5'-nucleotidase
VNNAQAPEGRPIRILITNDDGITAPGLLALKRELEQLGRVMAVAPDRPRSASGHAITLHKPLRVARVTLPDGQEGVATNGTPSDCVLLAVGDLLDERPALVVSGINQGPNLGEDLTYSGTVSAAMEGAIMGIPSFAISVASYEAEHFDTAARFAGRLAREIQRRGLPPGTFLNVNVPDLPEAEIAGVAVTRQGRCRYSGRLEKRTDLRGRTYYWLAGDLQEMGSREGTDLAAIAANRISITPVQLDLTHHEFLAEMRSWQL